MHWICVWCHMSLVFVGGYETTQTIPVLTQHIKGQWKWYKEVGGHSERRGSLLTEASSDIFHLLSIVHKFNDAHWKRDAGTEALARPVTQCSTDSHEDMQAVPLTDWSKFKEGANPITALDGKHLSTVLVEDVIRTQQSRQWIFNMPHLLSRASAGVNWGYSEDK